MPVPPLPAQRIGFARASVPADLPPGAGLRPRRELSAGGFSGGFVAEILLLAEDLMSRDSYS